MKDAILRKARESSELQLRFFEQNAAVLERCVTAAAERFRDGARLWTFGNGGSACDAEHLAVEFAHPIIEKRRALPAQSLTSESATITAIGNDADFSQVFAQRLELLGRRGDLALGVSTSGASANVTRALARARELGMVTIGFAGRDGGQFPELCDHCFVVPSWSIHRIQETQTILLHLFWDQVQVALGETDVL